MHGLINRTIQCFTSDTYGDDFWHSVMEAADVGFYEFESMLTYEESVTHKTLAVLSDVLGAPVEAVLEDIGTYLVSHKNAEVIRRLLRFGGENFVEFLYSLDDLPERARLAVPDLDLPQLELHEHAHDRFSLSIAGRVEGFGPVMVGVLRAMADDYGALVFLDRLPGQHKAENIEIRLIETAFAAGRGFDLGACAG